MKRIETVHIPSEIIMAYHDGELSAAENARVERHLSVCPDCRHELELFRNAGSLIAALPSAARRVRPDFRDIKTRAAALSGIRIRAQHRWHIRLHNAVRPLIATAAALIIVLTIFFLSGPGGEQADSFDRNASCMVEQETDAIVQGYDRLPRLYQ